MADPSVPLCVALEAEYTALTGRVPPRAPDVRFTAAQIRDPGDLLHQLVQGRDPVATMLRESLIGAAMPQLTGIRGIDVAPMLAARLNTLLDDDRLFDREHRTAFVGIALRSETADAVDAGSIRMRNRLVLEDAFPQLQRWHDIRLTAALRALHDARLSALCLSGGGIRSATIALGAITALARRNLLQRFDYLSTVSGGGYAGAWLSAWIARRSMPEVIEQLRRRPQRPLEPEPAPVRHLRSFTNYLTPRVGIFSADTWTVVATYLRNLLLNWLVFLPPLVAVLSIPLLLRMLLDWHPLGSWITVQVVVALLLGTSAMVAAVCAVRYVHVNRPRARGATESTGNGDARRDQRAFLRQCLGPLVYAGVAAVICWAWATAYATPISGWFFPGAAWKTLAVLGGMVHVAGWFAATQSLRRIGVAVARPWVGGATALGSGLVLGALTGALTQLAPPLWALDASDRDAYLWLAFPALLALVMTLSHVYVGITSNRQSDAAREWSARFTAWLLIASTVWFVGVGLVMIGPTIPAWVASLFHHRDRALPAWLLSIGAFACGITAAMLSRHEASRSRWRTRAALLMVTAFFAALVVVLSRLGMAIMQASVAWFAVTDLTSTAAVAVPIGAVVILFLVGLLLARLIDSNKFSLHAMYRARLIAAYLGASREAGVRAPNRFTGFDDNDNMPLRDLKPRRHRDTRHRAPLHVLNATLNLVGGANLAWQERKAEPFTLSALHCGSPQLGYRPTQCDPHDARSAGYAGEFGVSLGTAMAISGAAMSPAMGYYSSPVLSLLLTFFNVRLGWWLGNPGHAGRDTWQRSSPRSSLRPIIDEALGLTDDRNAYVYLSDGGHFENLGLHAMVMRRCHTIVVIDASDDATMQFADVAEAIRKIRIDLGIPIHIDLSTIERGGGSCAIGTIDYPCADAGATAGTLVYLKPELGAADDIDVTSYARRHAGFPHDGTIDQWFTESQFESYRVLGARLIDGLFDGTRPQRPFDPGLTG